MAITLPTPLRVAAGIVASGIDLVRSLPEEIPALPVTLVGKAMQLSMKVQQEIADLATKGDEFLSGVLGGPQENPPWAQFDDEPPPTAAVAAGSRHKDPAGPAMPGGAGSARAGAARAGTAAASAAATRVAEGGKAPVVTPLARSTRLASPDADAPAGADEQQAQVSRSEGREDQGQAKRKQDKPPARPGRCAGRLPTQGAGLGSPVCRGNRRCSGRAGRGGRNHGTRTHRARTRTDAHEPTAPEPTAEPTDRTGAACSAEPAAPEPTARTHGARPAHRASDDADDDAADDGSASPDAATRPPHHRRRSHGRNRLRGPRARAIARRRPADTADTGSANGQASASTTEPAEDPDDGPAALPDYDRMTLAQVRGYLRSLSAQEVQSLLDHEQSGENRAPFLTLLSNRLVTLEHQES